MAVMYPKYPYDAAITGTEHWTWQPDHYCPPIVEDGEGLSQQRPVLAQGQYIRIRLLNCGPDCQGPHTLTFSNKTDGSAQISPFEAPFDEKQATYQSPWETMFKVASSDQADVLWKFDIECKAREEKIDPEFHVGTGPALPGST